MLNRVVHWCTDGIRLEADPRHAELVVREFGVEGGREAASIGDKEFFKKENTEANMELLDGEEATRYRATVARLNYMCPERPDLHFAVKELAKGMANPKQLDLIQLKRLARYLKGRPRLQLLYCWQATTSELNVFTDPDYAGTRGRAGLPAAVAFVLVDTSCEVGVPNNR